MASTVVTHLILFIAVLGIATGVVVSFKSFADDAESSIHERSEAFQARMQTSFEIDMLHHNNETNTTKIYARNTGEESHRLEDVGVYLNGIRIPHAEEDMTIQIEEDTVRANEGQDIWDKGEIMYVEVYKNLEEAQIHKVVLTTPHDGREEREFSI